MQALTFVEAGRVEWREAKAPVLGGPAEALVKPLAVSRCDLDSVIARGKAPAPGPFPLGHECVAEVVAIGDAVKGVRPGDHVIVPFQISCGACPPCTKGHTGSCSAVPKLSAYGLGPFGGGDTFRGALSDLLRVPFADAMLVRLPSGVDPVVAAALGDNAVDGFRTVAGPLAREPGAKVLVAAGGAPSVGLYAVASAVALGASEVVYVDPSEERAALAEKLGAKVVRAKCEESLRVGRFPITVDATGREEGLRFVLRSTDVYGECTSVGIYFGDVPFPLLDLYTRGIRFTTGRVNLRADLPTMLGAVSERALDLTTVATRIVTRSEAAAAWTEPATKLVVRM
ncbi:MAG: alcohol dehydrogenase catalytic domain-containing protein [Deltaproteobacteria bacterium]|nr:alcohol dehydrogenase catalytic domain-containing protein [Deltaproteobacteria bacterium]